MINTNLVSVLVSVLLVAIPVVAMVPVVEMVVPMVTRVKRWMVATILVVKLVHTCRKFEKLFVSVIREHFSNSFS